MSAGCPAQLTASAFNRLGPGDASILVTGPTVTQDRTVPISQNGE